MSAAPTIAESITQLLASFKMTVAAEELAHRLLEGGFEDALPIVQEVLSLEDEGRRQRRTDRLRRASKLAPGKTFETFDTDRLPLALTRKLRELATGDFCDRAVNGIAFGLPGSGKTHAASAIGHALVEDGRSVLFSPTFRIVQHLLAAKRDLELPRALRKLDHFDLLILDDIGYVQQSADEIEVLFTLMAERYERRSMLITSNLVFSEWDSIFKNPMTTAAAIDRLVHHSVILEFDVPSYRTTSKANAKPAATERSKKKKR